MSSDLTPGSSGPSFIPLARPVVADAALVMRDPSPMMLMSSGRGDAALDVVMFVGLAFVALIVSDVILGGFAEDFSDEAIQQLGVLMVFVTGLVTVGIVSAILRLRGQSFASIGMSLRDRWLIGPIGLLSAASAYGVLLMYILVVVQFAPEVMGKNQERIAEFVPEMSAASIVMTMCVVGFYEEIIFRGFLLTRLRRAFNSPVIAVLLSSSLFALAHAGTQEWLVLPGLFLIAVLWSWLVLWRQSIVSVMIGHALFNSVQLIGMQLQQQGA